LWLPDDGSYANRNMLEQLFISLIVFNSSTILCIWVH